MSVEEQAAIDSILDAIGEFIEREESGVSVINMKRAKEFATCDYLLRHTLRGRGIKIETVPHDSFGSAGVIRISANSLSIREPMKFARALKLASNYEIYPKLDGKIMLALTFYGMTDKIKE